MTIGYRPLTIEQSPGEAVGCSTSVHGHAWRPLPSSQSGLRQVEWLLNNHQSPKRYFANVFEFLSRCCQASLCSAIVREQLGEWGLWDNREIDYLHFFLSFCHERVNSKSSNSSKSKCRLVEDALFSWFIIGFVRDIGSDLLRHLVWSDGTNLSLKQLNPHVWEERDSHPCWWWLS